MKKSVIFLSLFCVLTAGVVFFACKKKDTTPPQQPALDQNFQQFNDDESRYKEESDNANTDINNAIKDMSMGKNDQYEGVQVLPCGATIDSSQVAQKILFFNFDGV